MHGHATNITGEPVGKNAGECLFFHVNVMMRLILDRKMFALEEQTSKEYVDNLIGDDLSFICHDLFRH